MLDDYGCHFRSDSPHTTSQQIDHSELKVRVPGTSALKTACQLLVAVRKDGSSTVRIDSLAMQVWTKGGIL